jgi:uncharacterized RmlC-like cupin family protein
VVRQEAFLMAQTDRNPTCAVVSTDESFRGKQGFDYVGAISAQSVGAEGICMHMLAIPPGGRAKPHLHEHHETAIYVLSGEGGMWYGDDLRQHLIARAGQFVYIPANVPHLPYNRSATEPCVAVLARTDPNEQESVVICNIPDPGMPEQQETNA